jgi:hypothetical protein
VNLTFRRNFGEVEENEWENLLMLMEVVSLSQEPDTVRWCLERSSVFTTSALYNALTFPGVPNRWMISIWIAKIPLKIKINLWQVCNDKIQSAEQLAKKNWAGPTECKLCGQLESAEHIFVQCVLARFCWSVFRDVYEWVALPTSLEDIHGKLVEGSNRKNRKFVFILGCLAWSLWLIHNDFIFNSVLVSSPNVSLY